GEDTMFMPPYAFSADGTKLAAVAARGNSCESVGGGTACRARADVLHLIDLRAWREVTAPLPGRGWVWPLAFSPDAARLALAYHEQASSALLLFDVGTGQLLTQRALDFQPSLVEYTGDGAVLVVYGAPLGAVPGVSKPGPPRA